MTLISNFEIPRQDSRGIVKPDFGVLKMDFKIPNPKFVMEIMASDPRILILEKNFRNEILKKSNIPILAELLSHFVFQFYFFDEISNFYGLYTRFF